MTHSPLTGLREASALVWYASVTCREAPGQIATVLSQYMSCADLRVQMDVMGSVRSMGG